MCSLSGKKRGDLGKEEKQSGNWFPQKFVQREAVKEEVLTLVNMVRKILFRIIAVGVKSVAWGKQNEAQLLRHQVWARLYSQGAAWGSVDGRWLRVNIKGGALLLSWPARVQSRREVICATWGPFFFLTAHCPWSLQLGLVRWYFKLPLFSFPWLCPYLCK